MEGPKPAEQSQRQWTRRDVPPRNADADGARDAQQRQIGNQAGDPRIQRHLQEDVMGVGDVIAGGDVQGIEQAHHLAEGPQPTPGEEEVLHGGDRPAPDLLPEPERAQVAQRRHPLGLLPERLEALRTDSEAAGDHPQRAQHADSPQNPARPGRRQHRAPQHQQQARAQHTPNPAAPRLGERGQKADGPEGKERGKAPHPTTVLKAPRQQM